MTILPLITKYRPTDWDLVVGNTTAVESLSKAVAAGNKSFLLTGPSGLGKTTLARIIATKVNAHLEEICAATYSSVEDTRNLVEFSKYKPLNKQPILFLIDECHNLSKKGWEPLLKIIEEPPEWIYFALCTTDVSTVPKTIITRCHPVALKPLKPNEIADLITVIAELEGWCVTDDTFNAIVQASQGSPRKALTILQAGHFVKTRAELAIIINEVETESDPAIEICRLLLKGNRSWERIQPLLEKIDSEAEVIPSVTRYITVALISPNKADAIYAYGILSAIADFKNISYDQKAQFAAAVCQILFSGIGGIIGTDTRS